MSMARCRLKLTSCCAFLLIGLVVNCRCHLNNNTKPANVREFDSCQYAVPVWHHLINRTQAQQLESIQKRAVHIIYNITCGMSYPNVLFVAELESLETRRTNLSRSFFFQDICKPTSCLYHLILPPRDASVITRLRPTTSLPKPSLRTKKYCSFINFGLHHYQPKK